MASLIRFLFPTALAAALILSSCTRSVQKEGPVSGTAVPAPGSIAYSGTDGNIYVIDAAGGTIHQVTQNAKSSTDRDTEYLYPAWSFDGQRLAYVGYSPQKDGRIESTLYVSDRKAHFEEHGHFAILPLLEPRLEQYQLPELVQQQGRSGHADNKGGGWESRRR